jgi:hypothetical protein
MGHLVAQCLQDAALQHDIDLVPTIHGSLGSVLTIALGLGSSSME